MNGRRRLVLASASPARRRLLEDAGFAPLVIVSNVDEDEVSSTDPASVAVELAERKASAVAALDEADVRGAIVVGCDSVLDVDGAIHGKPADDGEARRRLLALRGRSAVLRTGHCVIDASTGERATGIDATVVRFGDYSDAELDAYLSTGEARAVAGAFTLLGRSAPFLDGIEGDPGNVIGLSLPLFRRLLGQLGLQVVDLWV